MPAMHCLLKGRRMVWRYDGESSNPRYFGEKVLAPTTVKFLGGPGHTVILEYFNIKE